MSLAQETTQDHRLTIVPDFTDLGKFEIGQTKELKWSITCPIAKVKVICEQETNVREKEVEKTEFVTFQPYLYGTSVMKDENKAVKYLIFSVKEGETRALKPLEDCNQDIFDFYALFELGTIYLNGISKKGLMVVEKDIKKATNYFERAANKNNIHAHDPLYPTYPSHDTVNQSLNSKSLQGSFDSLDPIYPIYREGNNVEVTRPNNGQAYLKLCEIYLGDGLIPRNLKKAKYCLNEALKCGNINVTHLKKQRPVFCEACNI
ncbi:hypothetical protein QTN25_003394 [Entamoeba marina]